MKEIDLNLLRIFEALADEGHATRAARRVGLSQPAFSHALRRLRDALEDPLFVRIPRGMTATPRALALEPRVRDILARARELAEPDTFDPGRQRRTFRIGTTDYFEHFALPHLAVAFAKAAPEATLVSRPIGTRLPRIELEQGGLDLAIAGFFGRVPDGYYQQSLFDDTFACVVRRDHPDVGRRMTLARYTRLPHLLIAPGGGLEGVVDEALDRVGRSRHIAVAVGSFLSAGFIVANSDLILTAPRRVAVTYQQSLPVRVLEPPVSLPGVTVVQIWHGRHNADPSHAWLRRLVAEATSAA